VIPENAGDHGYFHVGVKAGGFGLLGLPGLPGLLRLLRHLDLGRVFRLLRLLGLGFLGWRARGNADGWCGRDDGRRLRAACGGGGFGFVLAVSGRLILWGWMICAGRPGTWRR
jgi:hypothetical protein